MNAVGDLSGGQQQLGDWPGSGIDLSLLILDEGAYGRDTAKCLCRKLGTSSSNWNKELGLTVLLVEQNCLSPVKSGIGF